MTNAGITGMMIPNPIMSISTVMKMNVSAWREFMRILPVDR